VTATIKKIGDAGDVVTRPSRRANQVIGTELLASDQDAALSQRAQVAAGRLASAAKAETLAVQPTHLARSLDGRRGRIARARHRARDR